MGLIFILLTAVLFLLRPETVAVGAGRGLALCGRSVLPALFPFFVLTDFWVRSGSAGRLSRAAGPVMERVFHLPGSTASAVLLGAVGGYPMGVRTAAQLYQNGCLSRQETEQVLRFCNNAGPAFVLTVLGRGVFQSRLAGAVLYGIHLLSAFLIGVLLRPRGLPGKQTDKVPSEQPLVPSLTDAIARAGGTTVQVCSFILFFSILTQFLPENPLIQGQVELTGGAERLASAAWPPTVKFAAAAFLLGFGGICVQLQSQAILQQAGLSSRPVWIGKLLQGLVSGLLALAVGPLLPLAQCCMAVSPAPLWIPSWGILALLLVAWLLVKKTSGNTAAHRI